MTYYIKQKVFSLRDRFSIYNEQGEDCFTVEGKLFSLGKKLHLYDRNGEERCFVHQKLFSFLPRFFVSIDGQDVAEVVKKFTLLKQKYEVIGPGWTVDGDFTAHAYTIRDGGGRDVAVISKRWLSWGDTYEISIGRREDTEMALGIVLIIDAVLAQQAAASTSSSASHNQTGK